MVKIFLKDGSMKEVRLGTTLMKIAEEWSKESESNFICAAKVNGEIKDLQDKIVSDCNIEFVTFDSLEGKNIYRHTSSHILAQAVKRLFPEAKLGIGPAIENGFYYDFDIDHTFTSEDISNIETEMRKIIKENLQVEKFELSAKDAREFLLERKEPYKVELAEDYSEKGSLSFRKQGEFVDMCSGIHLPLTGMVKAIKITNSTGAYWKGNSKNKMLKRLYGTSFPSQKMLDEYLKSVEEAKKRDHNKIGRELEFFTTVDYIGQGLPILLPKGSKVIQLLQRFVEDEEEKRGYLLTKTPFLAKNELYKISEHWYHYKENMFILGDESKDDEVFALRPMTCPFQFQVYLNKSRSYRDLPMRLNETSTLFRNESSGEMHGLIRLRQFTISEGHIACTPDQLESEFRECLELARYMLRCLKLENDVTYRFSKWDENNRDKYIGSAIEWENVQGKMREILDKAELVYDEADGEAAFYGPKLDIQFKNVHGKEDTLITIQIDFQLAKKFGMEYVDKDGEKKFPYVIHRTSLGCYERTLALLIEKYAGALPLWIAPEQVKILPISEEFHELSLEVQKQIRDFAPRVSVDLRNEKIGYKIREAQVNKVPYMVILGSKEAESNMLSVRSRSEGDLGAMSKEEFIERISKEISEKR